MAPIEASILRACPLLRLLASSQPGEVSAAVAGLQRILRSSRHDTNDFVDWVEAHAEDAQDEPEAAPKQSVWLVKVSALLAKGTGVLADRDLSFLLNVKANAAMGISPSPKQQKWIGDIEQKLRVRTRAG